MKENNYLSLNIQVFIQYSTIVILKLWYTLFKYKTLKKNVTIFLVISKALLKKSGFKVIESIIS